MSCCSVNGCGNSYWRKRREPKDGPGRDVKFYCFPNKPWQEERKQKWIQFCHRKPKNGKPWQPTKFSVICNAHFEGGKRSEHPGKVNFNPTIFIPRRKPGGPLGRRSPLDYDCVMCLKRVPTPPYWIEGAYLFARFLRLLTNMTGMEMEGEVKRFLMEGKEGEGRRPVPNSEQFSVCEDCGGKLKGVVEIMEELEMLRMWASWRVRDILLQEELVGQGDRREVTECRKMMEKMGKRLLMVPEVKLTRIITAEKEKVPETRVIVKPPPQTAPPLFIKRPADTPTRVMGTPRLCALFGITDAESIEQCEVCQKAFFSKEQLEEHKNNFHTVGGGGGVRTIRVVNLASIVEPEPEEEGGDHDGNGGQAEELDTQIPSPANSPLGSMDDHDDATEAVHPISPTPPDKATDPVDPVENEPEVISKDTPTTASKNDASSSEIPSSNEPDVVEVKEEPVEEETTNNSSAPLPKKKVPSLPSSKKYLGKYKVKLKNLQTGKTVVGVITKPITTSTAPKLTALKNTPPPPAAKKVPFLSEAASATVDKYRKTYPFHCTQGCGQTCRFSTQYKLEFHEQRFHATRQCHFCPEKLTNLAKLILHELQHVKESSSAEQANSSSNAPLTTVKCPRCPFVRPFPSRGRRSHATTPTYILGVHYRYKHFSNKTDTQPTPKKVHRSAAAPPKSRLPFPCPQETCRRGFYLAGQLDDHQKTFHSPLPCHFCDTSLTGLRSLVRHEREEHDPKMPGCCPRCKYQSPPEKPWVLLRHYQRTHLKVQLQEHKCHLCPKTFSFSAALQSHLRAHENRRKDPFTCDQCGKVFTIYRQFYNHKRRNHLEEEEDTPESRTCPTCGKVLTTRVGLKNHMRMHSADRIVCDLCGKLWRTNFMLRLHKRRAHPEEMEGEERGAGEDDVMCDLCGKTFFRQCNLAKHKKAVHPVDENGVLLEKPEKDTKVTCDGCGKEYKSRAALRMLMRKGHPDLDEGTTSAQENNMVAL